MPNNNPECILVEYNHDCFFKNAKKKGGGVLFKAKLIYAYNF